MGWLSLLYIITGIFQSGGWPSNVAVMGVWFGKSTRGLVMGIWNTHTSVGNILGSLIATAMLGNAKTQYEYHQFDVDIPHTPKESIHTAKMTLKDAEDWCDASSKCVAFTATGYDGSAAATWSFTNATCDAEGCGVKHVAGANCTATGHCTFQKDVPWDLSFYVLGAIIFGGGIIILLFLVPHPRDVGLASPDEVRFPPSFFVFVYCLPLSFARFFTVFSSFPYRIVGPGGSQGSRGLRPRVVSQRISHGRQRRRSTNSPIDSI